MSRLLPIWFWIIVFSLSIIGMLYLGFNPEKITRWWAYLFSYNLGFCALATLLIFRNIRHLKQQESAGVLGAKLTTSFIKIVPLIAILPLVSFYVFSFNNIQGTVADLLLFADDLQKERQNKLDILASDLGVIKLNEYQTRTQSLLDIILQSDAFDSKDNIYQANIQSIVQYLVEIDLACDVEVYNQQNQLIAAARNDKLCPNALAPSDKFSNLALYEAKQIPSQYFFKSEAVYANANIVLLRASALYNLDKKTNLFLEKLHRSRKSQLSIELNLAPLRNAFLIDMSSTLLLTILSILMIIFKIINTLMVPLNRLSEATKQVAKGDYDVFIPERLSGDVGILIDLFNRMAEQVKSAQYDLETQHLYLETILQYSYGVIALDEHYRIRLLNSEISKILHVKDLTKFYGKDYLSITQDYAQLYPLTQRIKNHFDTKQSQWTDTIEITLNQQSILLSCQGATLETAQKQVLGYVVILKDITQLRDAQNKAAWAAIAMKMAHEVKNPLTPILLCAERLRNQLLPKLTSNDATMLDKTTTTITEQVQSINTMVSAFAQYAKTPVLHKVPQRLSELIKQAASLYENQKDVQMTIHKLANEPQFLLDKNSMIRVFINLIKNSLEAVTKKKKQIDIYLHKKNSNKNSNIEVIFTDNGPGFSDTIKAQIFKPHISTKKKGSGLGMVIVKSILDEHDVAITLENRHDNNHQIIGARIILTFKQTSAPKITNNNKVLKQK